MLNTGEAGLHQQINILLITHKKTQKAIKEKTNRNRNMLRN